MNHVVMQAITRPVCFGKVGGFDAGVLSIQRLWLIQFFGNMALLIATIIDININPHSQNSTFDLEIGTAAMAGIGSLIWQVYMAELLRGNWSSALCYMQVLSFTLVLNATMQVMWVAYLFLRGSPDLGVVVLVCTCFFFLLPYAISTQHYRLLKHIHSPDAATPTAATPTDAESMSDNEQVQCVVHAA